MKGDTRSLDYSSHVINKILLYSHPHESLLDPLYTLKLMPQALSNLGAAMFVHSCIPYKILNADSRPYTLNLEP